MISASAFGFARRFGALPVPLQPAAGVDQRAVLLGEAGGRQAEHLGLDLGRIDVVVLAVVLPELGGLGRQRIDDDQVLELGERAGRPSPCTGRRERVEALAEVAVDLAWFMFSNTCRMS